MVLIDAGPLVALINASDNHHERCAKVLRSLEEPLITVWPAFTEAMYLLGFSWRAQDALWELVDREGVGLVALDAGNHRRIRELMKKYRDLPMDLADAALVSVAEREGIARIFTLDRKDFQLYRPHRIGGFQIIPGER
ncbi:MAG: hypothetical protein A3H91_17305 [Gammaproteobacteria bacterium RIFCSPLOWO2_02_FULL_61_13]|nr:MAG: hypothetical protein A3H91_17305 [Gammaproteobacteria bacterium RIFCSPLOWO2_02_FULL_61_13]